MRLSHITTNLVQRSFIELGMSDEHAKIYLSLIENGPASVSSMSKWTNIPRTTIYDFLEALEDWDLIIPEKGRKTARFSAQDPLHLLEQVKYKRNRITDTAYNLDRSLHQLELLYSQHQAKTPPINILVGKDGSKEAYDEMYRTKELKGISYLPSDPSLVELSGSDDVSNTVKKSHAERYLAKCALREISLQQIFIGDPAGTSHIADEVDDDLIKVLIIGDKSYQVEKQYEKYLFDGKVLLISPALSYALIIEDEEFYQLECIMFQRTWQKYYITNKVGSG